MFAYIKGILEEKSNDYVVIDVGGIGYKIFMSSSAITILPECGNIVKIHTYYHVREDNISLYGFNTKEELKLFELLISVSGIGTKTAISMLSKITPSSFALAVITEDVKKLTELPGIGKKGAQRIILELKDKLKAEQELSIDKQEIEEIEITDNSETVEEAMQALQILGYNKKEIVKAFEKIANKNVSVEELIKKGLSILSK